MKWKAIGILIIGLLVTLVVSASVYGAPGPDGSDLDADGASSGASPAAQVETVAVQELLITTGGKMLVDRYHGGSESVSGFTDYLVTTGAWTVDVANNRTAYGSHARWL